MIGLRTLAVLLHAEPVADCTRKLIFSHDVSISAFLTGRAHRQLQFQAESSLG